jgi:hypothetical protein
MPKPKIGNAVQFYARADAEPQAALVTKVYGDSGKSICFVAWCPDRKAFFEHVDVPHASNANLDGPFWIRPDETDEVD